MAQSVVTVNLNGQPYQMGCGEGEEQHILSLAREVEQILTGLKQTSGQLGDVRLLAMTTLILADQKHGIEKGLTSSSKKTPEAERSEAVDLEAVDTKSNLALEACITRLESLTAKITSLNSYLEKI